MPPYFLARLAWVIQKQFNKLEGGPWFYIQLPPGDYSIKARFKGEIKEIKNLTVPKDKRVQQGMIWDLGEPRVVSNYPIVNAPDRFQPEEDLNCLIHEHSFF